MSAINPDEIISILKEEIENYDEISRNQEIGTVISVGDGSLTLCTERLSSLTTD